MNPPAKRYRNRVLSCLPKPDIERISRLLTPVTLDQYQLLMDGKPAYGYFLEEGMGSVVVGLENGATVEVGIVGLEGVVGLPILLGATMTADRTSVQIAGSGYRISAADLKAEFEREGPLRVYLQKYIHAFFVQTAQTAACNRMHTIEERLARWLLSCRDRTGQDELNLTHEFVGQMLGTPRTTVTLAAGLLHRAGMIEYRRGSVTIKDHDQLEQTACECYGVVRKAYDQL